MHIDITGRYNLSLIVLKRLSEVFLILQNARNYHCTHCLFDLPQIVSSAFDKTLKLRISQTYNLAENSRLVKIT